MDDGNGDHLEAFGANVERSIANAIFEDLYEETDANLALRKALLLVIFLSQDKVTKTVRQVYAELLDDLFEPLASHFVDHNHPFFRDFVIGRRVDNEGNVMLALPPEIMDFFGA